MEGIGPVTLNRLQSWLSNSRVTVKPVIDLPHQTPVDAYEIPNRVREAIHLISPVDSFPYATSTSRSRRPRPHHPLPATRPGWATRPNPDREPRTTDPPTPPHQKLRPRTQRVWPIEFGPCGSATTTRPSHRHQPRPTLAHRRLKRLPGRGASRRQLRMAAVKGRRSWPLTCHAALASICEAPEHADLLVCRRQLAHSWGCSCRRGRLR